MEQLKIKAEQVWSIASRRLIERHSELYSRWFSKLVPLRCSSSEQGETIVLGVNDDFFGQLISEDYNEQMAEALRDIDGVDYLYEWEAGHVPPSEPEQEVPVQPTAPPKAVEYSRPHLRPGSGREFTFQNFIVGDENRHAFAAAKAVSEMPGEIYNPLFIYGPSGVGKTHLMNAISAAIQENNPKLRIRNMTCDELLTDFYNLLTQHQSLADFRSNLRDVDVLLVDDIHNLAQKKQIQEEFFNVFNTLYKRNAQIVLTSDRQPCELSGIEQRLTTRIESEMVSELNMPGFEARMAILRMWRNDILSASPLPDKFLEFVATNITSSVRRLKSAFFRLATYASLSGSSELTIQRAEELLRAQIAQESKEASVESIQHQVSKYFGVSIADILGSRRTNNIVIPRLIAMYLCRELTMKSTNEIGAAFGRNHATILSAEKRVVELCEKDENIRRSVNQLRHEIKKSN